MSTYSLLHDILYCGGPAWCEYCAADLDANGSLPPAISEQENGGAARPITSFEVLIYAQDSYHAIELVNDSYPQARLIESLSAPRIVGPWRFRIVLAIELGAINPSFTDSEAVSVCILCESGYHGAEWEVLHVVACGCPCHK